MRLWVLIAAAALLAVAGCGPQAEPFDGPRPGPSLRVIPPPPPEAAPLRAGPAPIGIGLPQVHRVAPQPRRCKIKEKTVVQNGHKRVTRYQVCK